MNDLSTPASSADPQDLKQRGQDLVREATLYVRDNPMPALIGAVAVGFAIGLLARSLERQREPEPLRDALNEIRSLLTPITRKTHKAYAQSSDAIRSAVEKAKDLDVDDYVEPVAAWWKRFWS